MNVEISGDKGPIDTAVAEREATSSQPPASAPYPPNLLIESPYKSGVKRVKTDRWFEQSYHDREVERIWKKCWQMVCREEEIPENGDYVVYDVAHLSFIVVRSPGGIRAYWNSCPHRGRKLKEHDGRGIGEIRCMFHGMAWHVDGEVKDIPCKWDFAGAEPELKLTQAQVGTWGGWVFINPDPGAQSLASFLGTLPQHFEGAGHDMAKRWKQVHVGVILDCNWKVAQEAFLETWHVSNTHPQWVFGREAEGSLAGRWDDFGNWMRMAPSLPTDSRPGKPDWARFTDDPQAVVDTYYDQNLNEPRAHPAPANLPGMALVFSELRKYYRDLIGDQIDRHHDVELIGGDMISVFPNFHPWGAFSRIVYRYRPYKSNPDRSIMEVMLFSPWPEGRPKPPPAKIHWLKPGQTTADAPELGTLGRVFLQDIGNMRAQQEGLKSSGAGYVILSDHNEAPVRHLHDLYEKWMGLENGE
jgi:phenylpropionate dioxygenase-like ring-hydroxylating dioxygenase large terminal subunit